MNFFEQELRKLFADNAILKNPSFIGRSCYGDVGKDLRVRVDFVTLGTADHYEALRATILNRTEGVVDCMTFRFDEVLGTKPVPGNPNFRNGVKPYIWVYNGEAEWYAYKPVPADYLKLQKCVGDYTDVFRPCEERRTSLDTTIQSASSRSSQSHSSTGSQLFKPAPEPEL